jgi:hypothetical protein
MLRILIFYILVSVAFCDETLEPNGQLEKLMDITNNKTQKNLCPYGDGYLPYEIFNSYVGWQCYEESYKNVKRFSIYACTEKIEKWYQIPCLKVSFKNSNFAEKLLTYKFCFCCSPGIK